MLRRWIKSWFSDSPEPLIYVKEKSSLLLYFKMLSYIQTLRRWGFYVATSALLQFICVIGSSTCSAQRFNIHKRAGNILTRGVEVGERRHQAFPGFYFLYLLFSWLMNSRCESEEISACSSQNAQCSSRNQSRGRGEGGTPSLGDHVCPDWKFVIQHWLMHVSVQTDVLSTASSSDQSPSFRWRTCLGFFRRPEASQSPEMLLAADTGPASNSSKFWHVSTWNKTPNTQQMMLLFTQARVFKSSLSQCPGSGCYGNHLWLLLDNSTRWWKVRNIPPTHTHTQCWAFKDLAQHLAASFGYCSLNWRTLKQPRSCCCDVKLCLDRKEHAD